MNTHEYKLSTNNLEGLVEEFEALPYSMKTINTEVPPAVKSRDEEGNPIEWYDDKLVDILILSEEPLEVIVFESATAKEVYVNGRATMGNIATPLVSYMGHQQLPLEEE
jgi:hypothetical protein